VDGPSDGVRLAELLGALSLGIDLGFGQPMEHVLRQCWIATRLCDLAGFDVATRTAAYYSALLVNVGCHTDAHEQVHWFGDDIAFKTTKYADPTSKLGEVVRMLRLLGGGASPLHRLRVGFEFALGGHKDLEAMIAQHARLARSLGEELHLPDDALDALGSSYERWDGKGWPGERGGADISLAARVIQLAEFVEVAHRNHGIDGALEVARHGAGSQFDPDLVALLCRDPEKVLSEVADLDTWEAVLGQDPALHVLSPSELDDGLAAIARFIDLKSPFTLGHSEAVARLASSAAAQLSMPAADEELVARAGLTAGFGRLGISNAIWDKPGPLSPTEWERVRLAPQLAQRMLHQAPVLAPIGRVVGQHRERMDGSGYPSGLAGDAISPAARVLAAADAYQSMVEPRAHRPARSPSEAADQLRADATAGRLDGEVVGAVLAAAGHRSRRRPVNVAGLTAREVEVLQLAARGLSNQRIADQLVVSTKTVGSHIEHIYTKIGASNRAGAALFAMRHGLLPED
jgi:HD-GYP domain-containing protein (c-di-GMP phosphodiesterase class II)